MKKTISLVLVLVLVLAAEVTNADFTFGTPTNLGPIVNSLAFEGSPDISNDGLSLFFDAYFRPGGPGDWDIWVATRDLTNGDWGAAVPLPPPINSPYADAGPTISADGLSLFFASDRPDGYGGFDLWVTTRATTSDDWEEPMNIGPIVNSLAGENHPSISADGLSLYFDSNWAFWFDYDICVVTRASINHDWGIPVWLGPATDWGLYDWSPSISSDALTLFFEARSQLEGRELMVARRRTTDEDWDSSVNLGPSVNTTYDDCDPSIATDGYTLYFCSGRPGGIGNRDLWQVAIEPVVDLNGDGIVDSADMCIMVDHWGENYPLCDIGPMPWGDGIVDVQDLIVLAEHLFEGIPPVEPEEVNVDEDDADSQVELEQGQILVVTLESNPTTGYRWEQVENQESILQQMGEAEFKQSDTGGPPLVGAGGWEIFRFKAISAGQTSLKLVYNRPWEEGVEPINTFSIEVVVN